MTDRFSDACHLDETEPGAFSWDVPAGWLQGRGAWGGLVIAASVNAVEVTQQQSADRRVRSVTAHMFGPLPAGTARIDVTPLRVGSAMTTWKASVTGSDGAAAAHSVIITGTPRAGDIDEPWGTASMPDLPDWRAVPSVPVGPPMGPEFGLHIGYRPALGVPGSGDTPRALGWVSPVPDPADNAEQWSAGITLGLVDAWWPASYVAMSGLRPMATVSFSAHLLVPPQTLDPQQPLGFESWVSSMEEGFTSETRRLWSPDGRLVVENHQSIVVIK